METLTVYDAPTKGTPLSLPESALVGRGGEGAVYVVSPPGGKGGKKIAVKIFDAAKLTKGGDYLRKKISGMVKIGEEKSQELINFPRVAWPKLLAYSKNGKFVGYGMRQAKGKPLGLLAHYMHHKEQNHFPDMDREKVAKMLIELWQSAQFLHERGIFIGDVNLTNVLCGEKYGMCWIDTDSFQVGKWRCLVGRPEMTPPEHQKKDYGDIDRNRESDLFSLAILSFQCLMLGQHPYAHIDGGNPVDNVKKGHFPYVRGGSYPGTPGGVPKGPWHKIWSHYDYGLKELFVRALKDGAQDPNSRPSAEEWVGGLKRYIEILGKPPIKKDDGSVFQHCR